MPQRGKLDRILCHWLRSCAVSKQHTALRAAVIGNIPGGDAGCRNSGNQRQTVGVGRYYGAGIVADVAGLVVSIVINVGRGVGLLPALFALMPVVAFIEAPSGIQDMVGRNDRLIEGDLVPAVCVAENLLAAGADPIFDVSGGTRAAVGVNGGMMLHIVSMVEFGNGLRFRMIAVPLAGSLFAPLRGFCGGGLDFPFTPVVAKGGDRLRFRFAALRAGKSLYASFRAGGRFGFYALVPSMRQFFHDSLLDEHGFAHRAVLSLGQTGLRTGGGNGGVSDRLVPRGRDHRHLCLLFADGAVFALTAVFGTRGLLVHREAFVPMGGEGNFQCVCGRSVLAFVKILLAVRALIMRPHACCCAGGGLFRHQCAILVSAGGDLLIGRVIAAGAGFISPPAGRCTGRVLAIVLHDVVSQRLEVCCAAAGAFSPLRTCRRAAGVFVVVAADLHDGLAVGVFSVFEIQVLVCLAVRQDEVSGGVAFLAADGDGHRSAANDCRWID